MKNLRLLLFTAASFIFLLAACSQTPEVQEPGLEPQFGTRDEDMVELLAYSPNTGALYSAGTWASRMSEGSYAYDYMYGFLRRYNRSGHLVWEKILPSGYLGHLTVDYKGNIYLSGDQGTDKFAPTGRHLYRLPDYSAKLLTDTQGNLYTFTLSYPRIYLTKYSSTGRRLFRKLFLNRDDIGEFSSHVAMSRTGNIYAVLSSGVVRKYDRSGTLVWSKKLLTGNDDLPPIECGDEGSCSGGVSYQIEAGLADQFHITGGPRYSEWDGDLCTVGNSEISFYRFNGSGVKQNQRFVASRDFHRCDDIYEENLDRVSYSGYQLETDNKGFSYLSLRGEGTVIKLTQRGTKVWSKQIGGVPMDLATYDGSELFVGGIGSLAHRPLGDKDAFLMEMNRNGNRVWVR